MTAAIPADLQAQIHQFIISGEFAQWRARTRPAALPFDAFDRYGRKRAQCTFTGCKDFYLIGKHNRTTLCRKHAMLYRHELNRRIYHMAPCAQDGCDALVYARPNRTGYCKAHAKRAKRAENAK